MDEKLLELEFDVPRNAKYVCASNNREKAYFIYEIKKHRKCSADIKEINTKIGEVETALTTSVEYLEPIELTLVKGKIYGYDDVIYESSRWSYSKIPCNNGDKYHIKAYCSYSANLYVILDRYGDKISAYPNSSYLETGVLENDVIIPENGAYLVVNEKDGTATDVKKYVDKLELKNKIVTEDKLGEELKNKIVTKEKLNEELKNISFSANWNYLYGKTLATVGDSITEGVVIDTDPVTGYKLTYGGCVAKRNNMNFLNYGVSGSTLQDIEGKNGFSNPSRYQHMASDIDYLTIWFGWNDDAYGTAGTLADTDATLSFGGALNTVLPYLIDKYPKAKIGLIVPYGANANIRNLVRQAGQKYGLAYLDLYGENMPLIYDKEQGLYADYQTRIKRIKTYLYDGVHPNAFGYEYISTIYENWLRSL